RRSGREECEAPARADLVESVAAAAHHASSNSPAGENRSVIAGAARGMADELGQTQLDPEGPVRLAVGRTGRVRLTPHRGAALGFGRCRARQDRDEWRNAPAQTWRQVGASSNRADSKANAADSERRAAHVPSANPGGPRRSV